MTVDVVGGAVGSSGGGVVCSGGVKVVVGVPVSGGVVEGWEVAGGVVEVGWEVVGCEAAGLDVDVPSQAGKEAHNTSVKTAIDQRRKYLMANSKSGIRYLISL